MGVPILPDLIDAEIEEIVNTHINEAFDFLQTAASCSGWSGDPSQSSINGAPSNGIDRAWVGRPYLVIESLDNQKALGQFLPYVMSRMIFDPSQSKSSDLQNWLASFGLQDAAGQLLHVQLGYRDKVFISFHFNDQEYTSDQVEKIWEMFKAVLIEFKQLQQ